MDAETERVRPLVEEHVVIGSPRQFWVMREIVAIKAFDMLDHRTTSTCTVVAGPGTIAHVRVVGEILAS
jgi:hypothetical protein